MDLHACQQEHKPHVDTVQIRTLWDTNITIPVPLSGEALRDKNHFVVKLQSAIRSTVRRHKTAIRWTVIIFCLISYVLYLAFSVKHNLDLAKPLLIISSVLALIILYTVLRDEFGEVIYDSCCLPLSLLVDEHWYWIKWMLAGVISLSIGNYLVFCVITTWRQVQSMGGMLLFIILPWATSKHKKQIKWRPVLWGLALQFILGILVLRWRPGYDAVKWLSQKINTVIFYSLDGAAPVFGDPWFFMHPFLMLVIPLVVYVGVVTAVFYHFGWVQSFAKKLGWLMDRTLGTTAIESVSIAVNIFLSVIDTMIMLKSYMKKLTKSEFHCFLVGAHSTIAGFAFGLFVLFGIKPQHLLTGAVMSAPAAVAIAKLNWPETEQSVFKDIESFHLEDGRDHNVFCALARGAWEAGKSAVTILIQVLAFMALFKWMDDTIYWFGAKVGMELSLSLLFSYMFMPLAYVIGIDAEDVFAVGNLMGLKLVANEFLGFLELGRYGRENIISERSQAIATYAMCGFSSFGTLAIMTGVWNTVDPSKTTEVVRLIPRIMMNSNLACFLTACIAGIFYDENIVQDDTEPGIVQIFLMRVLGALPSYKDLMGLV